MHYHIHIPNTDLPLLQRLLKAREILEEASLFLNPTRKTHRNDPFLFEDMQKATERTILAMKKKEHIIIFWDYDVDGIIASFLLYTLLQDFFHYKNVEIMFPERIEDWYGIKCKHIDKCKKKQAWLIITVDNGITGVEEVKYAKNLGIDIIITDHHEPTNIIPKAYAIINPKTSLTYPYQDLCGAGVAYKFAMGLVKISRLEAAKKRYILQYLLPLVAIATVADVVPLIGENRLIVKKWLEQINTRKHLPPSLAWFLDYLKINGKIDTYHIGFIIGPRINAGGRIASPYDSLQTFLTTWSQQQKCLLALEQLNETRKILQEKALRIAEKTLDPTGNCIIVADPSFHEGIIGIVAGKLTETYNIPSVIIKIDHEKHEAIGSLRGPEYFSIIDMLNKFAPMFIRYWWHKQAWWFSISLERLEELRTAIYTYCNKKIKSEQKEKTLCVDTELLPNEWNKETFDILTQIAPYGEGNQEPIFLFRNCKIIDCIKIGKNGNSHLKIGINFWGKKITGIYRWQGEMQKYYTKKYLNKPCIIYGKIKKSAYEESWFVDIFGIE